MALPLVPPRRGSSLARSASLAALLALLVGLGWILLGGESRHVEVPPREPVESRREIEPGSASTQSAPHRIAEAPEVSAIPSEATAVLSLEDLAEPAAPPSIPARLAVNVYRDRGGEAMPDVRLVVRLGSMAPRRTLDHTPMQQGTANEALLTGLLGRVAFTLPPGQDARLCAWEEGTSLGYREIEVAALESGEERRLEILWHRTRDLELEGRVVDRETGRAIAQASVRLELRGQTVDQTRTDGDGRYRFRTFSARGLYVRADADGYGTRYALLDKDPMRVELVHSAALQVRVTSGNDVPVPGALVRISAAPDVLASQSGAPLEPAPADSQWDARTNGSGIARFPSLTAGVETTVHLVSPSEQPAEASLRLAAGQLRKIELAMLPPGWVTGRLIDRAGLPIVGQEVWAWRKADLDVPFFECICACSHLTTTDVRGNFALLLDQGHWGVGPAPHCDPVAPGCRTSFNREFPARAFPVAIRSEETTHVEWVVDRSTHIRGQVLDELGRPFFAQRIEAIPADHPDARLDVLGYGDGRFALGPLQAGSYRLRAHGAGDRISAWVNTHAGVEDVELRLAAIEGRLQGYILDSTTGNGVLATIQASGPQGTRAVESQASTGYFELSGLLPGDYILELQPGSHFVQLAPRRVTLESFNGEVRNLSIPVRPAARVFVHAYGAHGATCEVSYGGIVIQRREVFGGSIDLVVPAGEVTIRIFDANGREATETVSLEPGEYRGRLRMTLE